MWRSRRFHLIHQLLPAVKKSMTRFNFVPPRLPAETKALRAEVRAFLAVELKDRTPVERSFSWSGSDRTFSKRLGAQGWIGMTWPKEYGGHERSVLERYVVLEELLAAGAPVGGHWIADRQSGPLLLRYGTEEQRKRYLPAIARGECWFCIGLSEPGAGSDLAAVRTKARKVDGGWRVDGMKLWTSGANHAEMMIALVRTGGDPAARQAGLSQFLIDMASPGITIRPITDLAGQRHFNEVFFDDVFVPESMLVGQEGNGWAQGMGELALERSGPDRYLSAYQLLIELIDAAGPDPAPDIARLLGNAVSDLWTIRQMSLSIAGQLADGKDPATEAALVKDLGAIFEQELPRLVQAVIDDEMASRNPELPGVLTYLSQTSLSFSLRGGTREILRGIVARGLGLR